MNIKGLILGATLLIGSVVPTAVQADHASLRVINNTGNSIWYVYITPAGEPSWGNDQLGDDIIFAGQSYSWNINWDGCYIDVKAVSVNGQSAERYSVDACGGLDWTLW